jgi:Zn-dependent protease with chaperone function
VAMVDQAPGVALRLDPTELPAPPAATHENRVLARLVLASIGQLTDAFALGLVVLAVIFLPTGIWRYIVPGAVLVASAAAARALGPLMRPPKVRPGDVEIPEPDEPELHAFVREIAMGLGVRPPDRIVATEKVNASAAQRGALLGFIGGYRTVAVGVPLFEVLDVDQLRAIIGHELGHLAGRRARLGRLAARSGSTSARIADGLGASTVGKAFLRYLDVPLRAKPRVRQARELAADRAAVYSAGRQDAADALRTTGVAGRAHRCLLKEYVEPLIGSGYRPMTLIDALREMLRDPDRVSQLTEATESAGRDDVWASHPPTPERIRHIASLGDTRAVEPDRRAARVLLREPQRWSEATTARWAEHTTEGETLPSVPWEAWCDSVIVAEHRRRAVEVEVALGQIGEDSGVNGLARVGQSGRTKELAAHLVASGWEVVGSDAPPALLRRALMAVGGNAAVDAGCRWTMSWSRSAVLTDPSGVVIDLNAWATAAAGGRWGPLHGTACPMVGPEDPTAQSSDATSGTSPEAPTPAPVPSPPTPPFQPGRRGWAWSVTLPRFWRGPSRLRVNDTQLSLNGRRVKLDDVTHVTLRVTRSPGPPNHWSSGVDASFRFTTAEGKTAKQRTSVTGHTGTQDVLAVWGYLWGLAVAVVGPRLRDRLLAEIERGEVVVADLVFSPDGVALERRRDDVVAWSLVRKVQQVGLDLLLVCEGREPLAIPTGATDAFVVPQLVAQLRLRYGQGHSRAELRLGVEQVQAPGCGVDHDAGVDHGATLDDPLDGPFAHEDHVAFGGQRPDPERGVVAAMPAPAAADGDHPVGGR